MKNKIGYIIMDGFKNADVLGTQAVLAFSGSEFYYIGDEVGLVSGDSQYALKTNTTFNDCPQLDILIIPNLPDDTCGNEALLNFIRKQSVGCKFVLGISNGVLTLAKTGIIQGRHVTANKEVLNQLEGYRVYGLDKNTFMKDGKFITSGPSTGAIEASYYLSYILRGKAITKFLELNLEYNPTAQFSDIKQFELPDIEYKPLRVVVTSPPNLYLPDIAGAVDVFSSIPNTEIYFVWKEKGETTSILGPSIGTTMTFEECPQADVLITGAIMPKDTVDKELLDFYKKQMPKAKAVVGVCAGVFVLGAAGFLNNRMAVTNLHMLRMLKSVGAIRHNTESISDGKFHTAGPAIGSYEVALQVVAQIYGRETAAYIEQNALEYNPNPLFNKGTPEKAGKFRYMLSLLISTPLIPLYKAKVIRAYKNNK